MVNSKPYVIGEDGLLKSGVIVRHLVLPLGVSDSKNILDWFSTIKEKAYINVMSQYTPFGNIENFKELQRPLTKREYENVIDYAISLGIDNTYYQEQQSADTKYIPKWDY
jgi:putative pyruvate formate lyase activating enzyme